MADLGLKATADWCRAIGSPLRAGLSVKEALRLAAKQADSNISGYSAALLQRLEDGDSLAEALDLVPLRAPSLLRAMAKVGERTGRFPEALRDLENYYRFQLTLRRQFISQMTYPVIQLFAALCIVGLLIYVMGILGNANGPGGKRFDPLGMGLFGASGAMIWFAMTFGMLFGVVGLVWTLRKRATTSQSMDGFLLRVPALGPCLESLAMTRLCYAMGMTMDSNLSIKKSLPLAFDATDNGAYRPLAEPIVAAISKKGTGIADAFEEHEKRFPAEFLSVVRTGEEAGSLPEEMTRLARHFNEQANLRMQILNQAAGWAVWSMVAALIVFLIFRLALSYVGILNDAVKMAN